jgi:hypothetical protein
MKLLQRLAIRPAVEIPPAIAATVPIVSGMAPVDIGDQAGLIRNAGAMQESAFPVTKPDGFVPAHHRLRAIRVPINKAPMALNRQSSANLAGSGHDAFAPENPGRGYSTGWLHGGTGKIHETTDTITPCSKHEVTLHLPASMSVANSVNSLMSLRYIYSCWGIRVLTNIS